MADQHACYLDGRFKNTLEDVPGLTAHRIGRKTRDIRPHAIIAAGCRWVRLVGKTFFISEETGKTATYADLFKIKREMAQYGGTTTVYKSPYANMPLAIVVPTGEMVIEFMSETSQKDIERVLHVHDMGVTMKRSNREYVVCIPRSVNPLVLSCWLIEKIGLDKAEPLFEVFHPML